MLDRVLKSLWERRVPHYLGAYLAVCWGVLEFVDWLVNRYVLSPYLTDVVLLGLVSLIPSVLLVAYNHGKPGQDQATKTEKIGVPANIIASLFILALAFGGKDLGAATTTVTVEDEEGNTVERVIPKDEFRKRFALFPFDNQSGDAAFDWLQYGVPDAVAVDLYQDLLVDVVYFPHLRDRLRESGQGSGVGIPLALKREVASDLHLDRFVTGSITAVDGEIAVEYAVHDNRGRVQAEAAFSDTSVFDIADSMSIQLKHDLELPARHIEETIDVPVSEILTDSEDAFRHYVEGDVAILARDDWPGGIGSYESAVRLDSTFAIAQNSLYTVLLLTNQGARGTKPLQAAMASLYRLPERLQFLVKSNYYYSREEHEKAYAVLKMWTELYPDDIDGHRQMAQVYIVIQNDKEAGIRELRKIFELDPSQADILNQIGELYEAQAKFDSALIYYETYADLYPEDAESFWMIGNMYSNLGDLQQAKEFLEKASLLEPEDVGGMVAVGEVETHLGNYDDALAIFDEAMAASRTAEDRAAVYGALTSYYRYRGQLAKTLENWELRLDEVEQYAPPAFGAVQHLATLAILVEAGQTDIAIQRLDSLRQQFAAPPWNMILPIGEFAMYLELEEPDSAERSIEELELAIETLNMQALLPLVARGRAQVHYLRGEHREAIARYEEVLELDPTEYRLNTWIGRSYRELGELDKATEYVERRLKQRPLDPSAHYEMALVVSERGDADRAREHLQSALVAWENADSVFKPAREAREKLAELGAR